MKKWFAALMTIVLFAAQPALFPSGAAADGVEGNIVSGVQCFADQKSAKKKGNITYHVIAHSVNNKNSDKAWVKVKVHGAAEVDGDLQDGVWDEANGTVQWKVKSGMGADVYHLNLKVREDASDQVTVGCYVEIDGKVTVQGKDVTIGIGTEIHQPVFNGYPDGTFRPKAAMTRAEAATIVARELDLMDRPESRAFTDVPSGHWAKVYIEKAAGAGYMVGDGKRFRPEDPVTLAEWIAVTLRIKGIRGVPIENGILDAIDGKWYANDAKTAISLGYFVPRGAEVIAFESAVSREVVAQLFAISLYRGELTDGETKVVQHWPDVPRSSLRFGWVEELSLVAHESEQLGGLKESLVRYLPEETEPF
ncbi:S-layer homology domain-containing protein [Paenibacillus alkalitolerans]|uniref:S-layer homology domain-containing protein n=1 Tax=Paenibacillus alkalitolerans TaxID=2799335 RepID=UPI0018F5C108|nr:S-layer homology domain-containing protein [Paenibacillus alkalitolerans]